MAPTASDTSARTVHFVTWPPLRRPIPDIRIVLIVDEINRGNIPKIFGELLFLLEYRQTGGSPSVLAGGAVQSPQNLFLIGTMNTADRSIALVDAALRRRFYFVPFTPTAPPVNSVLAKWLEKHGHRRRGGASARPSERGDRARRVRDRAVLLHDRSRERARPRADLAAGDHAAAPGVLLRHEVGSISVRAREAESPTQRRGGWGRCRSESRASSRTET